METHMRRWISTLGLGCVLTAIWLLPPTPDRFWDSTYRGAQLTPERQEALRIGREAQRLNEVIARTQIGDSLIRVVRAEGGVREPFVVALPDAPPTEVAERLETAVRREIRLVETLDPDVLVGVALLHEKAGGHPSSRRVWRLFGSEYFVGMVDGRQICVVVRGFADVGGQSLSVNGHRKLHRSGHRKLHTWRR